MSGRNEMKPECRVRHCFALSSAACGGGCRPGDVGNTVEPRLGLSRRNAMKPDLSRRNEMEVDGGRGIASRVADNSILI